jgi:molecular chaperone GrpE
MTTKIDKEKNKLITSKDFVNLNNKISKKEKQIKKIKKDFKKDKEILLRNIADLQNLLKRKEKEFINQENKLKKKYIIQIVDTLDLIKKAYTDKNPKIGIKLIINNIENILKEENVKYIKCIGKSFDHNIHHAITTVEKKDCEDDIIIDELKKGYFINNDILRPSQVVVTKKLNK